MSDRAVQFAPFASLKGYYDLIHEKERVVVDRIELMEDSAEILSQKLDKTQIGMLIKVIHYSDGEYISTEGIVTDINFVKRKLTIVKTDILFDNIYDIVGVELEI